MTYKIIVAAYNCPSYIEGCLKSIQDQRHADFDVCVIDDHSDAYAQRKIILDYCSTNGWRFILNTEHRGAMYNQVAAIRMICKDPDDVIVFLDGDDKFAHESVLNRLDEAYGKPGIELTYGSYMPVPPSSTCPLAKPYPEHVIQGRSYRSFTDDHGRYLTYWNHLRTFKFKLFQEMSESDWTDASGEWFDASADEAMMLPALELAEKHEFIPDVLLHYTSDNPISDWRVHPEANVRCGTYIRNLPPKTREAA